jgi:malonyl-CoA O-methyltransferase
MQDLRLHHLAGAAMNAEPARDADLSLRELYERWAPHYPPEPHNPLMRAEQRAMLSLFPDVSGLRALDLACGSGRYSRLLRDSGASHITAVDFSPGMLRRCQAESVVCATMLDLPFADGVFDIVVCGLAIGHTANLDGWMSEVARVLVDDGALIYSDFHPEAARAGLTRTFKDDSARKHTLPHYSHGLDAHRESARRAGLRIESTQEVRAGLELCESFPGADEFYARWPGLPLVLVQGARKSP